jgi:hypothetical protein
MSGLHFYCSAIIHFEKYKILEMLDDNVKLIIEPLDRLYEKPSSCIIGLKFLYNMISSGQITENFVSDNKCSIQLHSDIEGIHSINNLDFDLDISNNKIKSIIVSDLSGVKPFDLDS